jgi:hypothetical protein
MAESAKKFRSRVVPVSLALLRAYRRTSYTAEGASVAIGRRSAATDALLGEMAARDGGFVTAWNPLSRRMPDGWNRRMQRALIAHTRRLPFATGHGIGHGWSEEHLFVAISSRRLLVLARRFRQLGIVVVGRGRPARLVLLTWPGLDTAAIPSALPPAPGRDPSPSALGRRRWRTGISER